MLTTANTTTTPKAASWLLLCAGLGVPLTAMADTASDPVTLPALNASAEHSSAVGVSSGGYMALQLAIAWPERFSGVGVLAAGPWGCAQGSLSLALNQCMMTRRGEPSLSTLDTRWARYAGDGQVGDEAARSDLRAYVWHGEADKVVEPVLGDLLAEQLRQWLADDGQLKVARSEKTGHGWPVRLPSDSRTAPEALGGCRQGGGSHVLACDENIAGEMLDWLHPERSQSVSNAGGKLLAFAQGEFDAKGLADTGYAYVPAQCETGVETGVETGKCGVTIALHGCQMSVESIGETFVRETGLNAWADQHQQIVLYPQAESSLANPQGCWDWWGFAESTWQLSPLHDTREGEQVSALMAMLARLQAASLPER
jgi:poly(3-hydroxybutyrate) depolymerase